MRVVAPKIGASVLGVHIDALTWDGAQARILSWARGHESRYVCICNVHSIVTGGRDADFHRVLNDSDLATPDGMPLVWWLRRAGFRNQARIEGPELMLRLCELAAREGISVFLYGGSESSLHLLQERMLVRFPELRIVGAISPPFRTLTPEEDAQISENINRSGAGLVFVGLGCPKQEAWMWRRRGQVHAVMIGVGAAFDFHAGRLQRAPCWMQRSGLEWLFRLISEPRRLWRRYLTTNTTFVLRTALDCAKGAGPRGRNTPQAIKRNE